MITVASDVNKDKSQANQNAISVVGSNGIYKVEIDDIASYKDSITEETIIADGDDGLFKFTSTNPAQAISKGEVEWVGLVIHTDENLLNVTWNGFELTQDDIDEAASVGETDGKTIIFWTPYGELSKTITIGTKDGSKDSVTITIEK